jgi:hypothetical protein
MAEPVEVSYVKRRFEEPEGIEGLGGMWRGRPWFLSERKIISEIERRPDERQWDFFVTVTGRGAPVIAISSRDGRKRLAVTGMPNALLSLPE